MKKLFISLFFGLFIGISVNAQQYINPQKMMEVLEAKVNEPAFDFKAIDQMYKNFHLVQKDVMVSIPLERTNEVELSPSELYKLRLSSVYMFIQIYENKEGRRKINGSGTAFPISRDGHFLINYHMLEELGLGNRDSTKVLDYVKLCLSDFQGNILTIDSVLTFNDTADFAIIKANMKGKTVKPIPMGNDLSAGDDVFIIAHPRDYYYYYSTGRVARMTESGDQGIMSRKMEITADFAAGSSGGPVFDNKGNIAGMVSLTKSFYYDIQNQKNLQMVIKETIPVNTLKALIK